MKTTGHFVDDVLPERTYLTVELCAEVVANPIRREEQADGRIRFWGRVTLPGEEIPRIIRVVTLADGETFHIAFIDGKFARRGA